MKTFFDTSLFRPPLLLAVLLALFIGRSAFADDATSSTSTYDRIVTEYMGDKWDDLETDLKATAKHPGSLTYAQKQNLNYITQSFLESHPAWWNICKSGKQAVVKVSVFGVPIDAVYDPEQKQNFNMNNTEITLGWPAAEMDNAEQAEHGFTKGELNESAIWSYLGQTSVYKVLPLQQIIALLNSKDEAGKLKLNRIVDFRSNAAAAYYGSPRSRQWTIWLSMHFYQLKYRKSPNVMSRKSLGAMIAAEVLSRRAQYPSFKLPDKVEADNAEETVVMAMHDWIEKHHWTLAEDKQIREAIRVFVAANDSVIHTGGPVKFANGLGAALDPDEDAPIREKRDQWVVQHLSAAKK